MEGLSLTAGEVSCVFPIEPSGNKAGRPVKAFRLSIEQNVLDALVCRGILSQADLGRAVE